MQSLDELNLLVTSAIFKMQESAREVSLLEERIAKLTNAKSPEGIIARRGAVRTALTSGDTERARTLIRLFMTKDSPNNSKLEEELVEMLRQALGVEVVSLRP